MMFECLAGVWIQIKIHPHIVQYY
nr:unknown protein [Drosophila melanogaster]